MNSPFKFLKPYEKGERDIFFGRDKEIELLYNTAFTTNLILVYGQTGTGKTSIIRCGLGNRFSEADWIDLHIRRGDDIIISLWKEIYRHAESPIGIEKSITDAVYTLYLDSLKPVYLIFDQFEELFILGKKEEQRSFFNITAQLLESRAPVKIIFVMREDYIARLYDFEKVVPRLFNNRIRIETMTLAKIEEVISESAKAFKIQLAPPADTIKRIIEYNQDKKGEIGLPYLQVYLDRLYRRAAKQVESPSNSSDDQLKEVIFTLDLVKKVGKVSDVMASFLEVQAKRIQGELNEKYPRGPRKVVWEVLKQFATGEGTTLPLSREKILEKFTGSEDVIKDCLEELENARILNLWEEDNTYEIAHDALAKRIEEKISDEEKALLEIKKLVKDRLDTFEKTRTFLSKKELNYIDYYFESFEEKLKKELEKKEKEFIEKSKKKVSKQKKIIAFCAVAISLIIFFALFAGWKWKVAEANAYASKALLKVKDDPTYALRLAEKAKKVWLLGKNKILSNTIDKIYWENNFYKIIAKNKARVLSVAFSPDGKNIIAGYFDGTVRLLDLKGKESEPFTGHKGLVTSAAYSPDGKYILTGSFDRTARLWDEKGKELRVFKGYRTEDTSFTFSTEGKFIFTGTSDRPVLLWYLQGNELLALQNPVSLFKSTDSSPDGKSILPVSPGIKEPLTFKEHKKDITSAAFSPDGKYILTGHKDGTARLWDSNVKELRVFKGHEEEVTSVAFSPDRKYILTGSKDKTARLWDLQGQKLQDFIGHNKEVTSAAFSSPDGDYIITGSKDNTIRLWDIKDIKDIKSRILEEYDAATTYAAISPDGKYILTVYQDGAAHLRDLQGKNSKDFRVDDARVTSADFSPDSKYILTVSEDKTARFARLWDLQGNPIHDFKIQHEDDVTSAVFSPDGKYILTGSRDKTARLWDLQGNLIRTFKGDKNMISSLAFSPDSKYIVTGTEYDIARLWDLEGNKLQDFKGHQSKITSIAFSPDGNYILTASFDKTIRLWNLKGKVLTIFKGHEKGITSAVFSPDGKYILSGSKDKTARLWNLNGMQLRVFKGHENWINSVAFSPDSTYIITGSKDKTVRQWKIKMPLEDFLKNGVCQRFDDKQLKEEEKEEEMK
ncbi:MAG: hypothetical protein JSV88_32575 [Candidatus Aminicenantes bacterium]|nr:MAG: hypothetical protein JSV88_32575 [Candidatus Aminicenantes bacterium]